MDMVSSNLILLVDDSPVNNSLMETVLSDVGYSTVVATNGHEALSLFDNQRPDLIILDIMMPGMDGYELLESLKKKDPSGEIPVIMLTARNNMKDKEKAISMGAADYLIKPIDIEDTINRVQRALRN